NPTHTYPEIGTSTSYSVQLIASNTFGSNTSIKNSYISVSAAPPTLAGSVIYSDINQNNIVDAGDTLTLQFSQQMRVNGANATDFYLPVTGDSLGTGASVSINTANNTQVIITLGSSPVLTIPDTFNTANTTPGSPSGIDISSTMTPGAIEDLNGVDAQNGVPMDIQFVLTPDSTNVST